MLDLLLVLKTTSKVFLIIFLGVFISEYLEARGTAKSLKKRLKGITEALGIPDSLILPLATSFFAGYAGEALVSMMHKEQAISDKLIIPCFMLLDFPIYFSFVPLLIGITVPLAGKAGALYILAQLGVSLLMSLTGLLILRLSIQNLPITRHPADHRIKNQSTKKLFKEALWISFKISAVVFLAMLAVSIAFKTEVISDLTKIISDLHLPFFKPEMAPITAAHAFHIAAAAAVAGKLLGQGISVKTAVIGMLWGNLIGTPIRGLRLVIPRYSAMFGFKKAIKLWAVNQLYRAFLVFLAIVFLSYLPLGASP